MDWTMEFFLFQGERRGNGGKGRICILDYRKFKWMGRCGEDIGGFFWNGAKGQR